MGRLSNVFYLVSDRRQCFSDEDVLLDGQSFTNLTVERLKAKEAMLCPLRRMRYM